MQRQGGRLRDRDETQNASHVISMACRNHLLHQLRKLLHRAATPLPQRGTMLRPRQHVLYEHILVTRDKIKVCGEHIMAGRGPLHYQQDFFGAGEALTSYNPREKQKEWAATLVLTASSREAARAKEQLVIHNIMQAAGVHCYEDFAPGD